MSRNLCLLENHLGIGLVRLMFRMSLGMGIDMILGWILFQCCYEKCRYVKRYELRIRMRRPREFWDELLLMCISYCITK